jgi:hypothetical protein
MTDQRERRLDALKDALDENTKSKATDRAIAFTLRMRGNSIAYSTEKLEQLIETAEERGTLTAEEIAEILDTEEIRRVRVSVVGRGPTRVDRLQNTPVATNRRRHTYTSSIRTLYR